MVCSYLYSVGASSFLIPHSRRLMAGRVVQKLTLWRPAALGNSSTVSVCRWLSTLQSVDDNKCWQVSSHGRICNTKGIVTHGTLAPSGYRVAKISSSTFRVHHLVVYAFHGPSQNPLAWQVNHLDGNRSNNHCNNLERVTRSQNMRHAYTDPSRRSAGPKLAKPVMLRAVGSQTWVTCSSIVEAAGQVGLSPGTVSKCCHTMSYCRGFEFCFAALQDERIPGEIWKDMLDPRSGDIVPGRMISSMGRVRFSDGRISSGHLEKHGYTSTWLTTAQRCRNELVHRIVAMSFFGPPPSPQHTQVNHLDGNRNNNAVGNLAYVTPAENVLHAYATRARKPRGDVKAVDSRRHGSTDCWVSYPSISAAAAELGVGTGSISGCLKGRFKQRGGFEFRLPMDSQSDEFADEEWCTVDTDGIFREKNIRKILNFR